MKKQYAHPLKLTTPLMRGKRVKDAQWLLKGKGKVLKHRCYHGRLDGKYGPQCAGATKHAKYFLGYPNRKIDTAFGQTLYEYLTGKKTLSVAMKLRRAKRVRAWNKARKAGGLQAKAIGLASHYVGTKEYPYGSNNVLFSRWYGMRGPWCAMFISYVLSHVGRPFHESYVPTIISDAREGRGRTRVISHSGVAEALKAGHPVLACFDWNHDGQADHIGFVSHMINSSYIATIEGNTSTSNNSNGGQVMRRERYIGLVEAFVEIL